MNLLEATQINPLETQFQTAYRATLRAVREKELYRNRQLSDIADREWLAFFAMCDRFRGKQTVECEPTAVPPDYAEDYHILRGPMKGEQEQADIENTQESLLMSARYGG